MSTLTLTRNFALVIVSSAFLAACAQTQAEDAASSSRVDQLETEVGQLQSDVDMLKSELSATRKAAEDARMAAEKMDESYRKSLRK